jgi:hypothetical protein
MKRVKEERAKFGKPSSAAKKDRSAINKEIEDLEKGASGKHEEKISKSPKASKPAAEEEKATPKGFAAKSAALKAEHGVSMYSVAKLSEKSMEAKAAVVDSTLDRLKKKYPICQDTDKLRVELVGGNPSKGALGKYALGKSRIMLKGKLHEFTESYDEPRVGKGAWTIGDDTASVFRHEFGHYVYYERMSNKQRFGWDNIHHSLPKATMSMVVSQYGATKKYESFAEAFSAYTHPKYKKGMMPSVIEGFLATTLKSERTKEPMPLKLAFCPTGKGGGVDPTCSPGGVKAGGLAALQAQREVIQAQVQKERKAGGVSSATKKARASINKQLAEAINASGAAPVEQTDFSKPVGKIKIKDSNIGGTTGAKLVNIHGEGDWVMKTYSGKEKNVHNEYAANKLYEHFAPGSVPESKLGEYEGEVALFNKFEKVTTLENLSGQEAAEVRAIARQNLVTDAWLANWDAVGLEKDNIGVTKDGRVLRLDNGGALAMRAMGAPKGKSFGDEVTEIDTLRDPKKNAAAASVYGVLTESEIHEQIDRLESRMGPDPKSKIASVLEGTGAEHLTGKLHARYESLLERRGPKEVPSFAAAKTYSSHSEADKAAKPHYNEWRYSLDAEEAAAMKAYKGFGYAQLNGYLRHPEQSSPKWSVVSDVKWKTRDEVIGVMDRALAKAPGTPEPMIAYRGLYAPLDVSVGDIIEDKGYTSLTMARDVARKFTVGNPQSAPNKPTGPLLKINLPAGTKAAYADYWSNLKEAELVLPRGSKMRVLSVSNTEISTEVIK